MKQKQRWAILGSLLLATLVAGYLIEDEPTPEKTGRQRRVADKPARPAESPASRSGSGAVPERQLAAVPLQFPEPAAAEEDAEAAPRIDPFRIKSWYVAPPPSKAPPPKPTAPPLPFQYLGKLTEDGETRVFLNNQGKYLIAKQGDIIDGTYRIEEIVGGKMTLLYQPLQEKQILAIGQEK